jgi:hypothetical protein
MRSLSVLYSKIGAHASYCILPGFYCDVVTCIWFRLRRRIICPLGMHYGIGTHVTRVAHMGCYNDG